jgi:hypothetical protein
LLTAASFGADVVFPFVAAVESTVLPGVLLLAVSTASPCCAPRGAMPSNAADVRATSTRVVFIRML